MSLEITTQTIKINQQTFIMHPSGALFWKDESLLLIADVHFGKIMHFRKHGSAVPQKAIAENFNQLQDVFTYFRPRTICFLGDLFHSSQNNEWILFTKWVENNHVEKVLITGNHDVISPLAYEALDFKIYDELLINRFSLTHHPQKNPELFNIAGHIHPGIKLRGTGKQFLKVSCFYKNEHQMILPAFGNFTGKYILKPEESDTIYVNTKSEVIVLDLSK